MQSIKKVKHVCPKNCASSCSLISEVDHETLLHIKGDNTNFYTKGKLCQKGFSFKERNEHKDRLKYPLYQKKKGTNQFIKISWEDAYELICERIIEIEKKYNHFQPIAYYKGSGNIGIHHYIVDEFFSALQGTKIIGSANMFNDEQSPIDVPYIKQFDAATGIKTPTIIIWGANPAATNIHLIPLLIDAKMRGAKLVVIDSIRSKTADLADLYIQLRPNTDLQLVQLMTKHVIEKKSFDDQVAKQRKIDWEQFIQSYEKMNAFILKEQCDIPHDALNKLLSLIQKNEQITYILGSGLQKYRNSCETIKAIETFATIRGDTKHQNAGIYMKNNSFKLFRNQRQHTVHTLHTKDISFLSATENKHMDLLWITGANPLVQEANPSGLKEWLETIPFVVTVDHFLTPTAEMANLILPTTTFFEEMDIVISPWHRTLALNEQALAPYHETRSEWKIMTDIATKLQRHCSNMKEFPIFSNEEEYLNAQFTEQVATYYSVHNIDDLRKNHHQVSINRRHELDNIKERIEQMSFFSLINHDNNKEISDNNEDEKLFFLITPHHPYKLNSQFHYLHLTDEKEATIEINTEVAKELHIHNGEIITIYNEHASINVKAIHSFRVPKDVLMFYQSWYPKSHIPINDLIGNDTSSFYDVTVHVKKL